MIPEITRCPIKVLPDQPLDSKNNDHEVLLDFDCNENCFEAKTSTFVLILSNTKMSEINQRLSEALESGSIPIFICFGDCNELRKKLLLNEVIDWKRAAIFKPLRQIGQVSHQLLLCKN